MTGKAQNLLPDIIGTPPPEASPMQSRSPSKSPPEKGERKRSYHATDGAVDSESDDSGIEAIMEDLPTSMHGYRSKLQEKFEDGMQLCAQKRMHKKVAVLLLSWEVQRNLIWTLRTR